MKSGLTLGQKVLIGLGVTVAFLGVLLTVGRDIGSSTVIEDRAPPPELWSAVALDDAQQQRGEPVQVCTNAMMRQGFALPLPQINGERCLLTGSPQERGASFNARCSAGGMDYGVNIARTGDPDRDFTVRMRARPLTVNDPGALQTIRYRKLGPCPAGAIAGKAFRSGEVFDALEPSR